MAAEEARYLSVADILSIHRAITERTGFPPAALRDEGLLESAIMRPRMAAHYGGADLVRQCALLGAGVAQAQTFLDGNKLTAMAAADVFLELNGLAFDGDYVEFGQQLEALPTRRDSLEEATPRFEAWLRPRVSVR